MAEDTEHTREPSAMAEDEDTQQAARSLQMVTMQRSTKKVRLETSGSIYGFMLVYPEICRVRYNSYWHPQVIVAVCILFLNIVLQVTLTRMTGVAIMEENLNFRTSLLDDSSRYSMPAFLEWSDFHDPATCCRGADCHGRDRTCCQQNRSGAVGAPHLGSASRGAFFTKPSGKGSKKKAEAEGGDGALALSLCTVAADGQIDCVQPAFILSDHWSELDTDGDGQWTQEEAEEDAANLACVMGKGISIIQAFHNIVRGISTYVEALIAHGFLDSDSPRFAKGAVLAALSNFKVVPEDYFQVWRGVSVLCAARDVNRCGQLMIGGIFDGVIAGGTRLEHSLDLCQDLLKPQGICEKAHPVTFTMWRHKAESLCGKPHFDTGWRLENPYLKDDSMDILEVQYEMVDQFHLAQSGRFQFFLFAIVFIWLVHMLSEFQEIMRVIDFAMHFPSSTQDPFNTIKMMSSFNRRARAMASGRPSEAFEKFEDYEKGVTPRDGGGKIVLHEVCRTHKVTVWIMIFVRATLMVYLAWVGCVFTITTYCYVDLLMNAIALAFVFELPTSLFQLLVNNELKELLVDVQPFTWQRRWVEFRGPLQVLKSQPFYGLVVIPLLGGSVIWWNYQTNVQPVVEALECACFQTGPHCLAGTVLNQEWWSHYWKRLSAY